MTEVRSMIYFSSCRMWQLPQPYSLQSECKWGWQQPGKDEPRPDIQAQWRGSRLQPGEGLVKPCCSQLWLGRPWAGLKGMWGQGGTMYTVTGRDAQQLFVEWLHEQINDVFRPESPGTTLYLRLLVLLCLALQPLMIPQGALLCPQSHSAEQADLVSVDYLLLS